MAITAATIAPPPSEILHLDTEIGYRWILSDAERAHIASLLKTKTDAITLRGNIMTQERRVCAHCGKHSGLDDLVHNALALGIHNDDFLLDVLQHGPKNPSPPHNLFCSNCGEQHDGTFFWIPSVPW